ncbi:hypothetical protein [Methanobrevibacter sp.]
MLTALLIMMPTTGLTARLVVLDMLVLFSFYHANATFVKVPLVVKLTSSHNFIAEPFTINGIFQVTTLVPFANAELTIVTLPVALNPYCTGTIPVGNKSVTFTPVALLGP